MRIDTAFDKFVAAGFKPCKSDDSWVAFRNDKKQLKYLINHDDTVDVFYIDTLAECMAKSNAAKPSRLTAKTIKSAINAMKKP